MPSFEPKIVTYIFQVKQIENKTNNDEKLDPFRNFKRVAQQSQVTTTISADSSGIVDLTDSNDGTSAANTVCAQSEGTTRLESENNAKCQTQGETVIEQADCPVVSEASPKASEGEESETTGLKSSKKDGKINEGSTVEGNKETEANQQDKDASANVDQSKTNTNDAVKDEEESVESALTSGEGQSNVRACFVRIEKLDLANHCKAAEASRVRTISTIEMVNCMLETALLLN